MSLKTLPFSVSHVNLLINASNPPITPTPPLQIMEALLDKDSYFKSSSAPPSAPLFSQKNIVNCAQFFANISNPVDCEQVMAGLAEVSIKDITTTSVPPSGGEAGGGDPMTFHSNDATCSSTASTTTTTTTTSTATSTSAAAAAAAANIRVISLTLLHPSSPFFTLHLGRVYIVNNIIATIICDDFIATD